MLKVYKILPYGFASNAYLLTADGENAVVIDPSQERVIAYAQEKGLHIRYALLTHGHFDHVGACFALAKAGVPILCGEKERELVNGEDSLYADHGAPMPDFPVQATLTNGQKLNLCGVSVTVISTPGHTAGGVTYRVENFLFTGDTLFQGCVGRTDLPTGDEYTLTRSVKKLYALKGDFKVFSGHGEDSTLNAERKYNMCVRSDENGDE